MLLQHCGYEVVSATTAEEGLELFATLPISLVVTDHLLARGTGTETARTMKQVKPEVPILILSGMVEISEGAEIADKQGRIIGKVTSGGFGPSLNAPVAMGYVESAFAANGTEIDLMVRGKALPARIAPTPFVPNRYRR